MKEYIERSELEEEFNSRLKDLTNEYGQHDYYVMGFEEAVNKIDYIPNAADVEEVRHAKWVTRRTEMHDGEWYCTGCDYEPQVFENSNYCPHCGALMDKE